jgi:hypothetical protein
MKKSILLLPIVLTGCICTDADIKKNNWKYGGGYYLGDFLNFNDTSLKNDTLFGIDSIGNKKAYATIIKTKNIYFFGHKEIEIKSLKTGEVGSYFGK